jgi:hypothetical protein
MICKIAWDDPQLHFKMIKLVGEFIFDRKRKIVYAFSTINTAFVGHYINRPINSVPNYDYYYLRLLHDCS